MPLTADLLPHTDPLTLGSALGEACGDNAMNWAKAFCAVAKARRFGYRLTVSPLIFFFHFDRRPPGIGLRLRLAP